MSFSILWSVLCLNLPGPRRQLFSMSSICRLFPGRCDGWVQIVLRSFLISYELSLMAFLMVLAIMELTSFTSQEHTNLNIWGVNSARLLYNTEELSLSLISLAAVAEAPLPECPRDPAHSERGRGHSFQTTSTENVWNSGSALGSGRPVCSYFTRLFV